MTAPLSTLRFVRDNAAFLAAGAALTFLSSFGQTFFISLFAGEIRAAYGLSHGAWGGLYMAGTAASALVMVWAGALTDRFRVRVLAPVILLGLAAACAAMALSVSAWGLVVVIFALRFFGQGMTSHIALVAMSRWFVATRGRALSIATLGFAAGEALLPLLFVALLALVDWRLLWVAAGLVCLLGLPLIARLLAQERTPQSAARENAAAGLKDRHWTRAEALRHPLFWCIAPAILGPAAFNTALFFHQVHLAETKGWAHLTFVAFFPLYTATAVLSMLATGWLNDRLGAARLMGVYQAALVLAFALFAVAQSPALLVLAFLALGIGTGAHAILPNAFWAEAFGTAHLGAIKALAAALMVLGSALGPGITGLLIDLGIGLERQFAGVAIYFAAVCVLASLGIARAFAKPRT
jgi:MFS family permease